MATLTLRPNADGTYHTWNEVPNSGHVFSNQFEEGDISAWTGSSGTPTVNNTFSHHGVYSCQINPGAFATEYVYKDIADSGATIFIRWHQRWAAEVPDPNDQLVPLVARSAGGEMCYVQLFNDAGTKKVRIVSTTPVATYSADYTLPTNQWVCFELEIIRNAATGHYHLWIDGTEYITQSDLNTGASNPVTFRIGHGKSNNPDAMTSYIDCVTISTSGPIGVESRKDLVDDSSDNTAVQITSYVGEDVDVLTRKTVYNLTNHVAESGTITDVTAYCRAKYSVGGGNEGFKLIWKLVATEVQSVEKTPGVAYAEFSDSRATDPDGGAWSWADIDNLEIGAIPSALANTETIDISEFWIVVTYTVGGSKGSNLAQTMTVMLNSKMLYG